MLIQGQPQRFRTHIKKTVPVNRLENFLNSIVVSLNKLPRHTSFNPQAQRVKMGPANTKPKPRPSLLASIPIPISPLKRTPIPPPSSPIHYRRQDSEDGLLFAMSPDQTHHLSNTHFICREPSGLVQKLIQDQTSYTTKDPYSNEPFMYPVPAIHAQPQTTPRKRKSGTYNTSGTPTRRHALLKSNATNRLSLCSSSQTSEDESDFDTRHKTHPLTSAFSRSVSTATTSSASSARGSFSFDLDEEDDEIVTVPMLPGKRTSPTILERIRGIVPGSAASLTSSPVADEKRVGYGAEKVQLRELQKYLRQAKSKAVVDVGEVARGRPRERRASRGIDVGPGVSLFVEKNSN